jgi:hypothetical protein
MAQRRAPDRNLDTERIGAADEVADDSGRPRPGVYSRHRSGGVQADPSVEASVEFDDRGRRRISLGGFAECRSDDGGLDRCGGDLAGARPVNTEIAAELAMIARCP